MSNINMKRAIFHYDASAREMGDDLGVLAWGFSMFVVIILLFTGTEDLRSVLDVYSYLILTSCVFLAFYLWRSADKIISRPSAKYIFTAVISPPIAMFVVWLIGLVLVNVMRGQILLQDLQWFSFSNFVVITNEELVFRGWMIEAFLLLEGMVGKMKGKQSLKSFFKNDKTIKEDRIFHYIDQNKYFLVGGIVSSFLFGFLHAGRYGTEDLYPLVYLTILGLSCSYLRFKFGILPAILLHGMNNVIAGLGAVLL